ncbi:MAG: NB-ARC domain-containing protein, partial [Ignavibacteriales bacterium]
MGQVFLSYSRHDDEPFVKQLYEDLTKNGIDVWWDRKTMESRGRTFLQELRDAIEASDRLIAVVGPNAVISDYVKVEWEHALLFAKGVVPILRMGDHNLVPPELSKLHCLDFRKERQYIEALDELLRILNKPLPKLGPFLTSIPSLPPNYLPRKEYLNKLNELIMADIFRPVVTTSTKQITALQGMGGIGKSVLAATFARTTEIRRAFNDGILWVTIGYENPDPIGGMRLVGTAFGDDPVNYSSQKEAEASLTKVLSDKLCLIVLDDIWKVPHAIPFINALGPRSRLLITTRNEDVVTSLGAQECKLEVLSETAALELLANWCEMKANLLPPETAKVADECGYLPLALSMCGAMAKSGNAWSDILEALQEADLEFIESQLPNYPYPKLGKVFKVSIDFLSSEDPDAVNSYQELAIFPSDEFIPEATLATLWAHTGDLNGRNSKKLMTKLKDRALLRLDGEAPNRLISLHNLQLDYLRATADDLHSLHNQLLEAYGKKCSNKWSEGPVDGYFFEHLAYHMKEAGRKEEFRKLLFDFNWIQSKLNATDVHFLLNDYDFFPGDYPVEMVKGAIQLSANALKDKKLLEGQLLGRLELFSDTEIKLLMEYIRAQR